MAIYSLHHSHIGKSTQERPHTAAAHLRYISREKATGGLFGARMPLQRKAAQQWIAEQEDSDRKNGRVVDKLMLALPRELGRAEREALVRRFAERVTEGRAPWAAAIHDQKKDLHNPHCHLVFRDRDVESGKRVFGTTERGSTERLRALWEEEANAALERGKHVARVDRRSLKARGIERQPTVHEGVRAQQMDRRGAHVLSKVRERRNGPGAVGSVRVVRYPEIDRGVSRPLYNRRLAESARESERDYRVAVDDDATAMSLAIQKQIHRPNPAELREIRRRALSRPLRSQSEIERDDGLELD